MADIDIGPGAVPMTQTYMGTETVITLGNPANATGTLTMMEFWFQTGWGNGTDVKCGTFYGSGTDYQDRDFETIGTVTQGSKQTFSGLDCDVEAGDYLGCYWNVGRPRHDPSGFGGIYHKSGDQFGSGVQTYALYAGDRIAIYGEGDLTPTPSGVPSGGMGSKLVAGRLI